MNDETNKPASGLGLLKSSSAGLSQMLQGMRERLTGYQRELAPELAEPPGETPEPEDEQEQGNSEPARDPLEGLRQISPEALRTPEQTRPRREPSNARARRVNDIARRNARERMAQMIEKQERLAEIFRPTPSVRAVRGVITQWRRESQAGREIARRYRESQRREPTAGTQPAAARMAGAAGSHEDESTATPATEV
jgi:hypothetical protein